MQLPAEYFNNRNRFVKAFGGSYKAWVPKGFSWGVMRATTEFAREMGPSARQEDRKSAQLERHTASVPGHQPWHTGATKERHRDQSVTSATCHTGSPLFVTWVQGTDEAVSSERKPPWPLQGQASKRPPLPQAAPGGRKFNPLFDAEDTPCYKYPAWYMVKPRAG